MTITQYQMKPNEENHFNATKEIAKEALKKALGGGFEVTEMDYQTHENEEFVAMSAHVVTNSEYLKPYTYYFDLQVNTPSGLQNLEDAKVVAMGGIDGDVEYVVDAETVYKFMLGHHIGKEC